MNIKLLIPFVIILVVVVYFVLSRKKSEARTPITSLEEARSYVNENFKDSVETLWLSNNLQDEQGAYMAIILDGILKKKYIPDGFEEKDGYRIYRYKKLN